MPGPQARTAPDVAAPAYPRLMQPAAPAVLDADGSPQRLGRPDIDGARQFLSRTGWNSRMPPTPAQKEKARWCHGALYLDGDIHYAGGENRWNLRGRPIRGDREQPGQLLCLGFDAHRYLDSHRANPALLQVTPTTGITASAFSIVYEVHSYNQTNPTP